MQAAAARDFPGTKQSQVLVVDDDPEITVMLSRYLGGQGFHVRIATDGAQLRAAMQPPGFDVVLRDPGLSDGDGLGLMRELRSAWHGEQEVVRAKTQ